MSHIDKTMLRRQLRQTRQGLSTTQRRQATARINRQLARLLRRQRRIGLYWAVGSEVALNRVLQTALDRGAKVYLPYIEPGRRRLWFTPYRPNTAPALQHHAGSLNIPQFDGQRIRAHCLHTLIVPLVGIDQRGFRLGQGGGYYDVTLAHTRARLRPHTVGIGFACQQVCRLPNEAHDMPLDAFVCEYGQQRFDNPTRP